jgi:hypothetical protein
VLHWIMEARALRHNVQPDSLRPDSDPASRPAVDDGHLPNRKPIRRGQRRRRPHPLHCRVARLVGIGVKDKAFFARAWALYAGSVLSWQPAGDTPTRRAFYDSWMLGCLPVVSAAAARHTYGNIFRGRVFALAGLAVEDVIMVLPDAVMLSGERLLDRLRRVPEAEIVLRRRHLRSLAPLVQ